MKDSLGHGSDPRGALAQGNPKSAPVPVHPGAAGSGGYSVQQQTPMGWQTVTAYHNPTTAEKQLMNSRADARRYGGTNKSVRIVGDMKAAFRRQQQSIATYAQRGY